MPIESWGSCPDLKNRGVLDRCPLNQSMFSRWRGDHYLSTFYPSTSGFAALMNDVLCPYDTSVIILFPNLIIIPLFSFLSANQQSILERHSLKGSEEN
ncbi:hypothetical protein TNIN_142071 [Trichonephila inaurata madagascariensis]|uniref:Uncharacterized protein n=1 Tax=Trichonephila inaurata madagascariensis TaxID=2747483 RepID=A0A8X7C4F9_9ARAC|nr:hypothetical protein TNIN_142071 [Trichonephila inaurata madagascariensis]